MYWLVKWFENGNAFSTDFDTVEEATDEANVLRARGATNVNVIPMTED